MKERSTLEADFKESRWWCECGRYVLEEWALEGKPKAFQGGSQYRQFDAEQSEQSLKA